MLEPTWHYYPQTEYEYRPYDGNLDRSVWKCHHGSLEASLNLVHCAT